MSLLVGLMSGTSLDGVDTALVDFSQGLPRTLGTLWSPYPDEIRHDALKLQVSGDNELHRGAQLANALARCYADTVRQLLAATGTPCETVAAIGCHGQTVRHQPATGYSIQLNNPALLAELTGIPVVADFRSRDIAAGGQGAPLVPAFHSAVFGHATEHRVILNIGGIANLTDLDPGAPVRGFDCGPGNMLLDAWMQAHRGQAYDANGDWAHGGRPIAALLERLLGDSFFSTPPPKSCGRDEFNLSWLTHHLRPEYEPQDVQATLLELSALSIANAVSTWCRAPDQVFVCGGGAHNAALMKRLRDLLAPAPLNTTDILGQLPDWVEAVAFAWLAWRTLNGQTSSLPEVTGAKGPRILGAIYPR